jgi:hypothetical protein
MLKYSTLNNAINSDEIHENGIYYIYKNKKGMYYISKKEFAYLTPEMTLYKISSEKEYTQLIRKKKLKKLNESR